MVAENTGYNKGKKMIGERIKKNRQQLGWSLDKLADRAKCSKSFLWEIENDNNVSPSIKKLSHIAAALCVTVEHLLGEEALETATDRAFYREYLRLSNGNRIKLNKIMKIISED